MLPTRWLRATFTSHPLRQRTPVRTLSFERLEDRDNPSGGLLDPTFGSGGVVNLPNSTDNGASAVVVQPDGKVVVAGQTARANAPSTASITVQRFNRDGSLDTSFNRTGSMTIQVDKSDSPTAVALQPDGKIVVGGEATSNSGGGEFLVARVSGNGTLDATFGSKGVWTYASTGAVKKVAVLTDPAHPGTVTGIVAAAQGAANGTSCFEAIKLTPAGVPDGAFGSGGFAVLAGVGNGLEGASVSSAGEIYLVGTKVVARADGGGSVATGCLAALTPGGRLDAAFGGGAGYVLADPTGVQGSHYYGVAVQTLTVNGQQSSRIVVSGASRPLPTASTWAVVSSYTPAGALDTTFGSGGTFTIGGVAGGFNPILGALALEADGSIVVGGYERYTAADGSQHDEMLVGHLTADGAADAAFGPDGTGFTVLRDGQDSRVWGLAIDPSDGGVVTGGYSVSSQVARRAVVARFTSPL